MSERFWLAVGIITLGPACLFTALFLVAAPPLFIWCYFHPSPTIELNKSDWTCVQTYTERVYTGRMWTIVTKCASYERNGINQ